MNVSSGNDHVCQELGPVMIEQASCSVSRTVAHGAKFGLLTTSTDIQNTFHRLVLKPFYTVY